MNQPLSRPINDVHSWIAQPGPDQNFPSEHILACTQDGIAAFDRDLKCVLWNPAMEELTGMPASAVLERIPFELYSAWRDGDLAGGLARALAGESVTLPDVALDSEGTVRWCAARLGSWRDGQGRTCGVVATVRDVSDRHQQEATEQQFRLVWDRSADGMRLTDGDGTIVLVNEAYCQIVGRRKEDLLGQPLTVVYAEADRARHLAEYRNRFQTGQPACAFEREYELWDGRACWLEMAASLFTIESCAPQVLSTFREVTKRRQAEAQLRVQAAALQSAANAIVITDRTGKITWANPAFTRLTGYTFDEVLGQNPRILKSGRHALGVYEGMWQRIAAGQVWQGEMVNRRKNGTLYIEEMTITPVQNRAGEITHFIAVKMDVTARKEMETELTHSRQRFERVFQSNPAAIGICTLAEERFLDVNESFLRLLGYDKEEVIGLSAGTLGLWIDEAQHTCLIEQLQQQGTVDNYEIRLRTKQDQVRDTLISVERIQLGPDRCLVFILLDITVRKRLEEQFLQVQKMESLGTLAGGVAHDFNNILTILHGHANLALAAENLPARTVESLGQIIEAAGRATNLTRQLLTFSRKQPVQLRLLNLNEVVGNLTKMLRRIIGDDVILDFKYSSQIPSIMADVGMLEQIVLNLAVNARDAMPQGGSIGIGTEAVRVDAHQAQTRPGAREGSFVCLSVRDSGEGINPAILPRIFEPFFTTKEVGKGTGLGLATVHGIVQQHQGWIEVDSQLQRGTVFRIYIPASNRKKPAEQDTELIKDVRGGHETILLVEDEPSVQLLVRQILVRYGYKILVASSGTEALDIWNRQGSAIDLLLTDVVMPGGLTGCQLADRLRELKPGLKVVYTSGYSLEIAGYGEHLEPSIQFLAKPFPPHNLARIVRESLDGKPA